MPIVQEPLCETIFVKPFEDVFVQQIPKDLDNFVQNFIELDLLYRFEVFFEHVIKVENQSFRGTTILVDDIFEGEFYGQFDLGVLLHCLGGDLHDPVPELDELADEVFVFDLLISDKFVPFLDDEL